MKNKIKNSIFRILVCVLAVALLLPSMAASAVSSNNDEIGYESYTYWYDVSSKGARKPVYSKPLFDVNQVVGEAELDCANNSKIVDVHSEGGFTYILDTGNSRIIVLDENYDLLKIIYTIVKNPEGVETPTTPYLLTEEDLAAKETAKQESEAEGEKAEGEGEEAEKEGPNVSAEAGANDWTRDGVTYFDFTGADGVFVDKTGEIYIADTNNKRVLKCDNNGYFIREYLLPDSDVIPSNFNYAPTKVSVDNKGYVYILSKGSYYGAILYSPKDEFLGFYGANNVASTILEAMSTVVKRLFSNSEKMSRSMKALPFSFSDLWIDEKGFVYTATGIDGSKMVTTGQIKKLNPGGTNVLPSADINFGDEDSDQTKMSGPRDQNVSSVTVDDQGFIYCLDIKYGRIFIYDEECTMISAMGGGIGVGEQEGTFRTAATISVNGDDIVAIDSLANTLTVFRKNEFGKNLLDAQKMTIEGDYGDAAPLWEKVYAEDKNCQVAYWGLARSKYVLEEYEEAMDIAVKGYDRETYSLAFAAVRTEFIRDNFALLAGIVVLILGVVIGVSIYLKKKNIKLITNRKVQLATGLCFHPFDNFHEIKEKNMSSVKISLVIIALYYVFNIMQTTLGGFSFVYYDKATYNALMILLRTAGLAILWTVSNWAICTLRGGKGKMKEILTVFSYSLIPTLIGSIAYVVLTNVLTTDEGAFLTMFMTIATAYTIILLMIGTMIIQDFEFGEFIGTTLLTLLCMFIVLFLLVTVIILLQQSWGFIQTIYTEIVQLT